MNTAPTEKVQDVDNETSGVSADCLSISLTLRNIFKHFDNNELAALSCVNKLWNYEARSVMRERGTLIAHLKSDAERLEAFASDVQQMNVVPFAGVHFVVGGGWGAHELCQSSPTAQLPSRTINLDRLSWKHFSFKLNGLWCSEKSKWILFVRKILEDCSGSLERMSMSIYYKRNEVIEQALQQCSFPRLKVLKMFCNDMDTEDYDTGFLKTLVSHAPNLQELHSHSPLSSLTTVLEGSSARLMYSLWRFGDEVPESIIGVLRLERMKLDYSAEDFDVQGFNRITPQLLHMSCDTLRSMEIDVMLAVPLMCYGICLRNVTKLTLAVDFQQLQLVQPRVLRLVKDFDFTRIFPSLNAVAVECLDNQYAIHVDEINALIEPANLALNKPLPDRYANIKHLHVPLQDSTVRFYAEMFPDIEKLCVKECQVDVTECMDIPFGLIWTHWVDLKQLDVMFDNRLLDLRTIENLDSVFCGIFPEEVAQLRKKDQEYLKRVNIVPVMPSITLLKNLRTIKFHCGEAGSREPNFDDPTFIFSKVTKFLSFGRCPELVSVTRPAHARGFDVGHMEAVVYSSP